MKKVNQLKAGVFLSYFTTGINFIIHLVYTPLMIRLLGQSEYGLYTLVSSVTGYLSLFSLGFTGSYLRFYSRRNKEKESVEKLNGLYLTIFIIMAIISFVCGMILADNASLVFGDKLSTNEIRKSAFLMRVLVINISLTFPNSVFDSVITAHEKFLFQRLLNLVCLVFNPLIAMPLLLMGYKSTVLVLVTSALTVLKLAVNCWFCFSKLGTRFIFKDFDFSLFKEMWQFSFFIFLNMIIDQANWSVDKLILGRVSGTKSVAIYGVGTSLFTIYLEFASMISSVFAPRVNKIAAENKPTMRNDFTDLMIKVGRIQFCVLGLVLTGFIVFGKYFIVNIYSTSEYEMAYYVALLLMAPTIISSSQSIGIEIQRSVNKHQFRSITYFFMAIINVFISIPLSYTYGPVGAAFGTTISILFANGFIMNIYYYKGIGIDIIKFWKNIIGLCKGMIIPIVFGILVHSFIHKTSIVTYTLLIVAYSFTFIVSIYFIGLNEYEKNLIYQPIAVIFKKINRR